MESYERDRPATNIEQDLGDPGASVEATDPATPGLGSGSVGVGAGQTEAADVEQDVGRPGDAYSGETAATDPTLR